MTGGGQRSGTGRRRTLGFCLALAMSGLAQGATHATPAAAVLDVLRPARPAPLSQQVASVTLVGPVTRTASGQPTAEPPAVVVGANGTGQAAPPLRVSAVLLEAYRSAAGRSLTGCHLPVSLLAAIGQVESGSLVGRPLDAGHRTSVLGPVLDGGDFAAVPDTDGGRWDGDTVWDRAVGPMQFLPSTWQQFGVDGDGDGVADPQDVEDAAATTAAYLCYGGRDLAVPRQETLAILAYNHSRAYLRLVQTYQTRYSRSGLDPSATVSAVGGSSTLNAADDAPLRGDVVRPTEARRHAQRRPPRLTSGSAARSRPTDRPGAQDSTTPTPGRTSGTTIPDVPDLADPGPATPVDGPGNGPRSDPTPTTPDPVPAAPAPPTATPDPPATSPDPPPVDAGAGAGGAQPSPGVGSGCEPDLSGPGDPAPGSEGGGPSLDTGASATSDGLVDPDTEALCIPCPGVGGSADTDPALSNPTATGCVVEAGD